MLAAYAQMVVWDTEELQQFQKDLQAEQQQVTRKKEVAIKEARKTMRVNAEFELNQIERINTWIERIYQDERRSW